MAQIPAGTNRPGQLSRKETGDARELKARRWLEGKDCALSPLTFADVAAKSI